MKRAALLALCALVPFSPACDRPTPVAPEGATLTITANPAKIEISGTSSITVLARKQDGTPVNEGTEVTLSTNLGTIENLVTTNSGGVALATLRGDGRIGTATVQAFSGAAGEAMIEVQIGALAAFMELTAQPTVIPRDGGSSTLTATAIDADGAPIIGANITFSSEIGQLESGGRVLQADANGQVTDVVTVERADLASLSDAFFLVTATTSGDGGAPIEESIEIDVGGTASTIAFQATPTTIPITGGTVELFVLVRDALGDPLPGVPVNFLTDIGSLASGGSSILTDALGEARDTLSATESDLTAFGGSSFTVRVQAAGIGGNILESTSTIRIQTGIPRASFTATPVVDSCFEYVFTSTSTGQAPLTCEWVLDGTMRTGCTAFNHTFNMGGPAQRSVSLTATNSLGSDTINGTVDVPHASGACP